MEEQTNLKDVLKSVTTEHGALSVMIVGVYLMEMLCVHSLVLEEVKDYLNG